MPRNKFRNWLFVLILIGFSASVGVLVGGLAAFTGDLPQIRSLETFRPSAVTRIYSSDGILLAELYVEKGTRSNWMPSPNP